MTLATPDAYGRSIFLLDQFGYIDVPLPTIRTILSTLENAEVILTFAVDSLIDYLSTNDQTQETLEKLGVSLPSKEIAVAKDTRDWRQLIQFALHRQIPARTGARYYTPFFLWSADAHRDLWFIHLSGHYRAKDVMLDLHWTENNSFAHYGRSGLNMLGYDQRQDPSLTGLGALPGFFFDQTAREASHQMLVNQLPEKMSRYRDGVQFHELFSQLTNECPVSGDIMTDVVSELARMGVVVVKDRSGTTTRRAGPQHMHDVIVPTAQRLLSFGD